MAVFQPHRYTRTRDLFEEFIPAFNDADVLILTDVYPAGEEALEGAGSESLYREIKEHGHRSVFYVPELGEVPVRLGEVVRPGDMVVTLGAGDVVAGRREVRGDARGKARQERAEAREGRRDYRRRLRGSGARCQNSISSFSYRGSRGEYSSMFPCASTLP